MLDTITKKTIHTKQVIVYEIDLTQIEGNGDFQCPTCGVTISPEDETENVYIIIDEKIEGEDLEELTIQCNKCSTKIRLTGFPSLEIDPSMLK